MRGNPLSIGTLEEFIDENHAIVSSNIGPGNYHKIDILRILCEYHELRR